MGRINNRHSQSPPLWIASEPIELSVSILTSDLSCPIETRSDSQSNIIKVTEISPRQTNKCSRESLIPVAEATCNYVCVCVYAWTTYYFERGCQHAEPGGKYKIRIAIHMRFCFLNGIRLSGAIQGTIILGAWEKW
jgi:hypothetical protein